MSKDICTCAPLRRLTRRITLIYDHHLQDSELSITQYSLLSRIGREGPIANITLAQEMGMDRSTLSRALKPLMTAGWVQTVDLPEEELLDKRSFALQLSRPGRAKLEQARPRWRRAQDEIDRRLGPRLAHQFNDLIEDAYARLQDD